MKKQTLNTLIAGAVALTVAGAGSSAALAAGDKERCYGVVKAGHNDCGSADKSHSCAGQAKEDADGGEWVYVPKGLCDKLVGGSTEPKMDDHMHGHDH